MNVKELTIKNFHGYSIREDGVVYGKDGNPMKPFKNPKGYLQLGLFIGGKDVCMRVHRIVALAFIQNPLNKRTVNHKDFNKLKNDVSNLEWATHSEQRFHCLKHGIGITENRNHQGEMNPRCLLTEEDVRSIRNMVAEKRLNLPQIGELFGINRNTVSNIFHRRTWKHVI